jgi:hypothetical protein
MMMVVFHFAEFIFHTRSIDDFKNNPKRFEEIKRTIDRGKTDLYLLLNQTPIELLRAQWNVRCGKLLVDE